MQLRMAVVCDHAEVREGLLTVVSSGVTRIWRESLPAPLGVCVALQVELDPAERAFPHELKLLVHGPSGAQLAEVRGGVQVGVPLDRADEDEGGILSLPLDLRAVGINEYGWHTFTIWFDDDQIAQLKLKAAAKREPPITSFMPNRAARRADRAN